jgi:hypothetical protein
VIVSITEALNDFKLLLPSDINGNRIEVKYLRDLELLRYKRIIEEFVRLPAEERVRVIPNEYYSENTWQKPSKVINEVYKKNSKWLD